MEPAPLILVLIAVLAVCYGFSVLLRSMSEWWFFRRFPNSAARRTGLRWSPIVGVLAIAGAVCPLLVGLRWQEELDGQTIGWPHAIGAGLMIFAAWLGTTWAIGERARGRRWCRRCRYDMSDIPSLRCPECGREAQNERALSAPRRPRSAGGLSLILCSAGLYAFWVADRVLEAGPLMAIPTRVLMAGWRVLPDPWISETPMGNLAGNLEYRLSEEDQLSTRRRAQFITGLLKDMEHDPAARWDPVRIRLMYAAAEGMGYWNGNPDTFPALMPIVESAGPRRLEMILDEIGLDTLRAWSAGDRDERSINIRSRNAVGYQFVRTLIVTHIAAKEGWTAETMWTPESSSTQREHLRSVLRRTRAWEAENRLSIDWANETYGDGSSLYEIMCDAGIGGGYVIPILRTADEKNRTRPYGKSYWAAVFLAWSEASDREQALIQLRSWSLSDDPNKRTLAFDVTGSWCRWARRLGIDTTEAEPMLTAIVATAIGQGLRDDRVSYSDNESMAAIRVRDLAAQLIVERDPDGGIAMPLLREMLLEGTAPQASSFRDWRVPSGLIDTWLCNFADLADHPDPLVRLWIANQAGMLIDTPPGSLLDDVLAKLAIDQDSEVAEVAEDVAQARDSQFVP